LLKRKKLERWCRYIATVVDIKKYRDRINGDDFIEKEVDDSMAFVRYKYIYWTPI